MNTHNCFLANVAVALVNTAGPILLAGLTLVPVNGKPNICTTAKAKPIISQALLFSSSADTVSTTKTKTKVRILMLKLRQKHQEFEHIHNKQIRICLFFRQ